MAGPLRFVDLIVSLLVLAVLATAGLAVRRSAQENSVIIACAGTLGQLAQSLVLYEGLNDGHFPRTRYDPAAPLTSYTQPDAPEPFALSGPAANDVTASLFLLARTLDLPPRAFVCPSAVRLTLAEADTFDRQSVQQRSNFRARVNDSYALANMYPDAAATAAGYSLDRFHDRLPATFAVAADTNPGGVGVTTATTRMSRGGMREANSPNHERDGQNVMFADGSVQFYNSPFVGESYDNIYAGREVANRPRDATDSVLLPTWSEGPATLPQASLDRKLALVIAILLTGLVLGYIVWHGTRDQRARRAR